ncbi:LysM peptidoglycan-binding domain-containing protein [Candidatus Vesicomyidisocius sp. SY067_SCS001]|uniref:LysM peptidoglycan-binding domain-containing protein n=1 Tax=Candidatus Vesicomyidisocius sp. SY067_SCS001 TaxID=2732590 RepID=UPI001685A0FF|nr:LysM peptidoglycan-binding domain-containing protein [Candidatus Vesicomyosocius sp. SY067_SCS001]
MPNPIQINTINNLVIEKDLWCYISNRYMLSVPSQKELFWHIDWFKKNPDYLTRITKRARPYLYLVKTEVELAGLPIEIALMPIIESAYYPFSYSHGMASGLWQFIPSTGKLYGLENNWWYDARRDVLASTKAAVKYLKNLNKLFNGDWLLAIAAYNSGPGRVQKAITKNKQQGKLADFWHLDLPEETRGYVPRLLAVAELIKNPKKYGQILTVVNNTPKVQAIKLDSQFDLVLISEWAQLDLEQLYTLNPGLKRWATPSDGSYNLLLPIDKVAIFKENLSKYPKSNRVKWVRYQINYGDSLSKIAHLFNTTISQIKSVNNLHNNMVKVDEYLIVPVSQKHDKYYFISKEKREVQKINPEKIGTKVVHRVVNGDSLWSIARKYNIHVDNIAKWNHITKTRLLKVGKKLVLWQPNSRKSKDLSELINVGISIDRKIIYYVKSGDNLSTIAHKFGVRISQLKKWNQLIDEQPLQPRQKLIVIINVINSNIK